MTALHENFDTATTAQTKQPIVRFNGVSFAYNGTPVLTDVNLTVEAGDFACVVGPNGGGKTTLIKLMIGLLEPTRGSVLLLGRPPAHSRVRAGYVPQQCDCDPAFPIKVRDVVLMGRLRAAFRPRYSKDDKAAADEALRDVELYPLRNRLFGELERRGMGFMAIRPLYQGILTDQRADRNSLPEGDRFAAPGYADDFARRKKVAEAFREQIGESMTGFAIRFALAAPVVASVVVGLNTPEQTDGVVAAAEADTPGMETVSRAQELWRSGFGLPERGPQP